jgi:hypothetical protein
VLKREWKKEVTDAVSGSGWGVFSAERAPESDTCLATLMQRGYAPKQIRLSLLEFSTAEARKAEIMRQLALP